MEKYKNNVQDQFGNAISGVTVTVRTNPGGVLATIYSDNGVTTKSNPFTNDADGEFFFYAANGRYDIELTGPITETVTDWLLQDIPSSLSGNTRILTDTNAPGGPAGDVGTGTLDYYDNDESTRVASLGFYGSTNGNFRLRNDVHAGHMELTGQDTGGVERFLVVGDPDTSVDLYYPGAGAQIIRALTVADGFEIRRDDNVDGTTLEILLANQDGTERGRIGYGSGTSIFSITNRVHGASIFINGEDIGGVVQDIMTADPDGDISLFAAGVETFRVFGAGQVDVIGNDNVDTSNRAVNFRYANATIRGWVGHKVGGTSIALKNEIHGANVQMLGENLSGTNRTGVEFDPDGAATLYYGGSSNNSCLQTRVDSASHLSLAQVKHNDGNFYDIGLMKMPIFERDTNDDLDNDNQHKFIHKDSGGAVTFELQNSSNIQTGVMWMISNEDTEDITIDAATNGCTLRWFDGGGVAPPTGNRTLAEAGVCTIIKYGVAEYFIWGIGLS